MSKGCGREVEQLVQGVQTSDGAGVKLTRVLTQNLQKRLDPFLMLDAFKNENPDDYIGGFPDHPHRGFETVTYMLAGKMRHHDSAGNKGLLEPNGAQWMVAGSGLIHSELPEQDNGLMEGFQLWINLPAQHKLIEPFYRDIPAQAIPELITDQGVKIRLIAGQSHGVKGAVERPTTHPLFLDIHLPKDSFFEQELSQALNAFVYVYRGSVTIGQSKIPERYMGILANNGDCVRIDSTDESRLILVAGQPLGEPIVQYGPFVMNTVEEIQQAFMDYKSGSFSMAKVKSVD